MKQIPKTKKIIHTQNNFFRLLFLALNFFIRKHYNTINNCFKKLFKRRTSLLTPPPPPIFLIHFIYLSHLIFLYSVKKFLSLFFYQLLRTKAVISPIKKLVQKLRHAFCRKTDLQSLCIKAELVLNKLFSWRIPQAIRHQLKCSYWYLTNILYKVVTWVQWNRGEVSPSMRGFALVEILVATLLGSAVIGGTFKVLEVSLQSSRVARSTLTEQELTVLVGNVLNDPTECQNNLKTSSADFTDIGSGNWRLAKLKKGGMYHTYPSGRLY